MKRVLTYGTFDLLHYGHINLLKRAKALGDYLIVALSTDEFNAGKGKKAFHDYETRKMMLEAIRYVDLVIPEESWDQKISDVKDYHVDVVLWAVTGKTAIALTTSRITASSFSCRARRASPPRRSSTTSDL